MDDEEGEASMTGNTSLELPLAGVDHLALLSLLHVTLAASGKSVGYRDSTGGRVPGPQSAKHQPLTLVVWGKNDKIFPEEGAHPLCGLRGDYES